MTEILLNWKVQPLTVFWSHRPQSCKPSESRELQWSQWGAPSPPACAESKWSHQRRIWGQSGIKSDSEVLLCKVTLTSGMVRSFKFEGDSSGLSKTGPTPGFISTWLINNKKVINHKKLLGFKQRSSHLHAQGLRDHQDVREDDCSIQRKSAECFFFFQQWKNNNEPSDRLQCNLTGKLWRLADFEEVIDYTHLSEFRQVSSCLISRLSYQKNIQNKSMQENLSHHPNRCSVHFLPPGSS